jgi:hypothetical protein
MIDRVTVCCCIDCVSKWVVSVGVETAHCWLSIANGEVAQNVKNGRWGGAGPNSADASQPIPLRKFCEKFQGMGLTVPVVLNQHGF